MDWMDFNRDGEVDAAEMYLAEEMLCTSKEEHEVLLEMQVILRMMSTRKRMKMSEVAIEKENICFLISTN